MKSRTERSRSRVNRKATLRRLTLLGLFGGISIGLALGFSTLLDRISLPGEDRPLALLSQLYLQSNPPPPTLHAEPPQPTPSSTSLDNQKAFDSSLVEDPGLSADLLTPAVSASPTATPTFTITPSVTATGTVTRTGTLQPAPTSSRTWTPFPTRTRPHTASPTSTRTPAPTETPTITLTLTPGSPPPPTASATQTGTPTPSPMLPTDTQTSGCDVTANPGFESTLLGLINQEREDRGLHGLALQSQLQAAAQIHCEDMACNDFLSHTGSDGSGVRDRVERQGYSWSWIGENIYATSNTSSSAPQQAFNWWMNSTLHRNNLLSPNYTEIGIGYRHSPDSSYGGYFTAVFARP